MRYSPSVFTLTKYLSYLFFVMVLFFPFYSIGYSIIDEHQGNVQIGTRYPEIVVTEIALI